MDRPHDLPLSPAVLISMMRTHVRLWAIPAVAGMVLAAGYALLAPRDWRATQALIVRPEAASVSNEQVGKFSDLSEMKTLQETIFELAKSPSVVHATLTAVGPRPSLFWRSSSWPTAKDVDQFRQQVAMTPPGGAEFGKTEVFYLSVRDKDRQRASALVAALCDELEARMQRLRDQRAQSMVAELKRTVSMAEQDLTDRNRVLAAFEAEIGPDLGELRILNAEISGQGEISQQLQAIEGERRANDARRRENERLLVVLEAAQENPNQLIATPTSLLRSQPALSRLKDALVDAQIQTAAVSGNRAEAHPFVVAAREAEDLLRGQLHEELTSAIQGLEIDLQLAAEREHDLTAKWQATRERLARLAEKRAEYATLVATVQNHTRLVETARKNLADARARQAGAASASLISRIDGVDAGVRPVGPSRKAITAAGGVAGLILGCGLVFLVATPAAPTWNGDTTHADQVVRHPIRPERTCSTVDNGAARPADSLHDMTIAEAFRNSVGRRNGHAVGR